jgi:hypothetical protein
MALEDNNYCLNSTSISIERLNGEIIMISFESGDYFSCFGVASDVLTLISRRVSTSQIKEVLLNKFGSEFQVDQVNSFIQECLSQNIIVPNTNVTSLDTQLPDDYDKSRWNAPILEKFSEYNDLLLIDPIHDSSLEGWPNKLDQNKQ